jgi:heptosyltransferase-2
MRLLVRLPNWLGDIIMALPALRAVRRRWPDAHVAVAVPRPLAPLMAMVSGVDEVVPLCVRGWRDRAAWADDVAALTRGAFDVALLFTNSFASAFMAWRAGVSGRWGYAADTRSPLLTHAVRRPPRRAGSDRHHSRYYAHLVEALGGQVVDSEFGLEAPSEWRARASALLASHGAPASDRLIGVAPGAAYGRAKQWPPDRVAQVVKRCGDELGATCVLFGSAGDRPAGDDIIRALNDGRSSGLSGWGGASRSGGSSESSPVSSRGWDRAGTGGGRQRPVIDLIGRTDLTMLAGAIAGCTCFVSNDSGAMHLASALGVPVVAPFGSTDEWATAPMGPHVIVTGRAWCRPCLRRECPIDHRCMTTIEPAAVFAAVAGYLRHG